MVAGILRLIGIYMGRDLGRKNNEDLEFQTFDAQIANYSKKEIKSILFGGGSFNRFE